MTKQSIRRKNFELDPAIDDEVIEEFEDESPIPLFGAPDPGDPYPIDALDGPLKDAALGIHEIVQSPVAMCAQSVLASAAMAVQGHRNVKIRDEEPKPLSCYFACIAESGERKTSTDRKATAPIKERESVLRALHRSETTNFASESDLWQAEHEKILRQRTKDRQEKGEEINALGEMPVAPVEPILICEEPTWEGLILVLDEGPGTCGLFSNEAGMFVSGYSMSAEQRLKTAAGLSTLWDGEAIKRVRATDKRRYLVGKRLTANLMMQPNVGETFFANPDLQRQGLTSRFLVSYPESLMGTRLSKEPSQADRDAVRRYHRVLHDILQADPPVVEGTANELQPDLLKFSKQAGEALRKFGDDVERELVPNGRYRPIASFASKMREHAARLAGVLALIEDFEASGIRTRHVDAGIALARYYAGEWLRIVNLGRYDPELVAAEKLRSKLATDWQEEHISLIDIYRNNMTGIKRKAEAAKIVAVLEENRWLHRAEAGTEVRGEPRQDVWRIVRA